MKKNIIFLICFILCIITTNMIASPTIVSGVVLIKINPEIYVNNLNSMPITNLNSSRLQYVLNESNCIGITKIFSNSQSSDTNGIDLYGNSVKFIDLSGWLKLVFPQQANLEEILDTLSTVEDVIDKELDYYGTTNEVFPNEINTTTDQRLQWGLYNPDGRTGNAGHDINAPVAWDFQKGRNDVIVAIVDKGVDYNHPDLDPGDRSRIISGWNYLDNDDNVLPASSSQNHGTKIAGVIGAITNNGYQHGQNSIAGIMWNCKIMPIKIAIDGDENVIVSHQAQGINWARTHGAQIVNMSQADGDGSSYFQVLRDAVENFYLSGRLLVSAMGNDDQNIRRYPAAFWGVMAVGATNQNDQRITKNNTNGQWGSNVGDHISVVAPGIDYRTTDNTTATPGYYTMFSGTSLATPIVSAAAGLVLSQSLDRGLNLTNDDIKHILERTANDVANPGWDVYTGYGRINVGEAIKHLSLPYVVEHGVLGSANANISELMGPHGRIIFGPLQYISYYSSILPEGTYYDSRQYKVTWHVTFNEPYETVPFVWVRECQSKGWKPDQPNTQDMWINLTNTSTTGFDIETYYYWIGGRIGLPSINKYWPGNMDNLQPSVAYTVIGHHPISTPTSMTAVLSTTPQFHLSWQDNSSTETGFIVERSTDGTNYSSIGTVTTNGNGSGTRTFDDVNIQQNVTYYYRVHAAAQEFTSASSNVATITVPTLVSAYLTSPDNNSTNLGHDDLPITLMWNSVPGAQRYHVQVSTNTPPTSPFTYENTNVTGVSVEVKNYTTLSTTYYWRVCAVNAFGEGPWSTIHSFTTCPQVPAAPANFMVSAWDEPCNGGGGGEEEQMLLGGNDNLLQNDGGMQTDQLGGGGGGCSLYTVLTWSRCSGDVTSIEVERSNSSDPLTMKNIAVIPDRSVTCFTDGCFGGLNVHYYRIRSRNAGGPSAYTVILDNGDHKNGIKNNNTNNTSREFELLQNSPNPFNPTTNISFTIPVDCYVTLKIFNSLGVKVATLVDGFMTAGYKTSSLDASDLPSGVYYYQLLAGYSSSSGHGFSDTKKMLLLR